MAELYHYKAQRRKKVEIILVVLILFIAFFFRFSGLGAIPSGLHPEEVIVSSEATQALEQNNLQSFYKNGGGREGLFVNLVALSFSVFDASAWSLRFVSALIGMLTVLGLYLLARQLFNREIGFIASFLLAVSFWHVHFSRIGFREILLPFALIYGFYFLMRGLRSSHFLSFGLSGLFFGLALYTHAGLRFVPLLVLLVILNYWWFLYKDYSHARYEQTRNALFRGIILLALVSFFVFLPLGIHYFQNIDDFFGSNGAISILSQANPWWTLIKSFGVSLGAFNVRGGLNWDFNVSGSPLLLWPVGVFFIVGLVRGVWKIVRKKKEHDHFPTVHVLLLSWFFIMLLPGVLVSGGPHTLRIIGVLPAVIVFAAEGMWWLFGYIEDWYQMRHPHKKEARGTALVALVILLIAIGIANHDKYFNQWAKNPEVTNIFNQK